ncbi:EcsC family protein [Billgrantia sp. C5P2]|uniref:EcsC family protein n=1 Tax=Billgrantia sp. C5P2 TaxID=3436239 RepID=UPI003DA43F33
MSKTTDLKVIDKIKTIVLDVDIKSVFRDANSAGLPVSEIADFRTQAHNYWRIEDVMHAYAGLAARYSAMSGATAGIGGVVTAISLGGVDVANMAAQLYRLGQRLSILNGFDPNDPLQNEKNTEIYLCALGFDSAAQAAIKSQLIKASSIAGKRGAYSNPVIKLIVLVAGKLGKEITSKQAAKFIPVVGFFAGATVNYAFARAAANKMLESYKKEYFRTWQAEQRQAGTV